MNLNPKEYPIGSIVYYVRKNGCHWHVSFGTVIEHYADTICLQLYDFCDRRLIDGVPIKDFVTPTRWQKLPKDWTWNTKLFEINFNDPKRYEMLDAKKPTKIKKAIESGWLVKVQDNDYARFETEIDGKKGWRIVRKYEDNPPTYTSVRFDQVYPTWDAANAVCEAHVEELERQKNLTDEEWSIEKIDEVLRHWAYACVVPDDTVEKYREWILKLEHIEDVEVRQIGNLIQWKYWKNKRWCNIEL